MTVTVVIPAFNEEGNVGRLIHEAFRVVPREMLIVVDDGSSDHTGDEIKSLISIYPRLRYIRHSVRTGQSAAIGTGVLAARSPIIVTMDGDGQNDPADILTLMNRLGAPGHTGQRSLQGSARGDTARPRGALQAAWRTWLGRPS
jgi:dolichol-phosphate mannosyltransferase